MWEFLVHVFNRAKVHGSVLSDRCMRAAACLDAHNPLRRKRLRAGENELIFLRVNVVCNYIDFVVVAKPLAQRFNQRRFARANRAADPDAQGAAMVCTYVALGILAGHKGHERNSLVYCVSCSIEARSVMNAADPRSSIVAFLACAVAANTARSSSAIASCPSV